MDEFDSNGWSHIHHAAFNSYQKSISRFVRTNEDQLELLTRDGKSRTPLLVACSNGSVETVRFFIELGANLEATDASGFGVIEVSSFSEHGSILEYFIGLNSSQVNVYQSLVRGLDNLKGTRSQMSSLKSLIGISTPDRLQAIVGSGAIEAVIKLLDSHGNEEEAILNCLVFLEKIIASATAQGVIKRSSGIEALVRQLGAPGKEVCATAVKLLTELARDDQHTVDRITKSKGVEKFVGILEKLPPGDDVQLAVLKTIGLFCKITRDIQEVYGHISRSFKVLVKLLKECKRKRFLACLARTVALLAVGNLGNQDRFVNEDGISSLIPILIKSKPHETQMAAVLAVKSIASEGSRTNRELLQQHGCIKILTRLLRDGSRQEETRQLVAEALWAIAGKEMSRKYFTAKSIGTGVLIEFLQASSTSLNFIGAQALVILAEDIVSKRDEIVTASATQFLPRLVRKTLTPECTVLCVFQMLRALCILVGFRPNHTAQKIIVADGCIVFLVRFFVHSHKPHMKAQAAYTLSCIALGNHETNTKILNLFEFSRLIDLMRQGDSEVQLTAGAALALFAFNNVQNQKAIAVPRELRYSMFQTFLASSNDLCLAKIAFQVVILSRIFPDEDQASASATGIKLLVHLLEKDDEEIQAACSNFIAGLAHTRPGIPSAFVSIGTIQILARLLMSPSERVKAYSAVALGYLSLDMSGQRQLLNVCRSKPSLYEILCCYAKKVRLSQEFIDRWKHYQRLLCLPQIKHTVCLINPEMDENYTFESNLNENADGDSDDESNMSESSDTILPMLLLS